MTNIFRMSAYKTRSSQELVRRRNSFAFAIHSSETLDSIMAMARIISSRCCNGNVSGRITIFILRQIFYRSCSVSQFPNNNNLAHLFSFRMCFKLRVMILAVEMTHKDENGNLRMLVEVAPKDDCIILSGTRAFMVCSSSEDAKRLAWKFARTIRMISN